MSVAAPELGEYAQKCVEVIRGFVPEMAEDVEPAVRQLAAIYATEDPATVEDRFKEQYRFYAAAAETILATDQASKKLDELMNKGDMQ